MRIGVLSDTHGRVPQTRAAVSRLDSLNVDVLLHCGDIGSPKIVELLAPWPTHYVFGNVDRSEEALRAAIEKTGHTCHGRFGELTLDGVAIAMVHGDDQRTLETAIAGGRYQLVCCGHTHKAKQQQRGDTLVLNPGAVFRANPHTIATVETPSLEVQIERL